MPPRGRGPLRGFLCRSKSRVLRAQQEPSLCRRKSRALRQKPPPYPERDPTARAASRGLPGPVRGGFRRLRSLPPATRTRRRPVGRRRLISRLAPLTGRERSSTPARLMAILRPSRRNSRVSPHRSQGCGADPLVRRENPRELSAGDCFVAVLLAMTPLSCHCDPRTAALRAFRGEAISCRSRQRFSIPCVHPRHRPARRERGGRAFSSASEVRARRVPQAGSIVPREGSRSCRRGFAVRGGNA